MNPSRVTNILPSSTLVGLFGLTIDNLTLGRPSSPLATALGRLPNLHSEAREVAILATAADYTFARPYEHAGVGAKAGFTPNEIGELKKGRKPESLY